MIDLPPTYSSILGHEWSYPLGGYLMNDGSYMMLPNMDGSLTRVPHETKKHVFFQNKEENGMDNFLDMGLGNYVVLEYITNRKPTDQIFDELWKLFFDGAYSKNGSGIGVIIESLNSKIKPMPLSYNLIALIIKQGMKLLSKG